MGSGFFDIFTNNENNEKDLKNMTISVKTDRCPQNHACPSVRSCPVGALKQKGYAAPSVDKDTCIKCGKCVKICPKRALVLE